MQSMEQFLRVGHTEHQIYGMLRSFIRKKYFCDQMTLINTGLNKAKQIS